MIIMSKQIPLKLATPWVTSLFDCLTGGRPPYWILKNTRIYFHVQRIRMHHGAKLLDISKSFGFQDGGPTPSWVLKFEFLWPIWAWKASEHQPTKFHRKRSNDLWDIAIYPIFKMVAICHLECVRHEFWRLSKSSGVAMVGHRWARAHPTSARVGREICINSKSFWRSRGGGADSTWASRYTVYLLWTHHDNAFVHCRS